MKTKDALPVLSWAGLVDATPCPAVLAGSPCPETQESTGGGFPCARSVQPTTQPSALPVPVGGKGALRLSFQSLLGPVNRTRLWATSVEAEARGIKRFALSHTAN